MLNAAKVRRLRGDESQAEVAYRAGLTVATLSRVERGVLTNVHLETLGALARALGVQAADLISDHAPAAAQPGARVQEDASQPPPPIEAAE